VAVAALNESSYSGERPDLVILAVGPNDSLDTTLAGLRGWLPGSPVPTLAVLLGAPSVPTGLNQASGPAPLRAIAVNPQEREALLAEVAGATLDLVPDLLLPLGRGFPDFRPTIAERLIRQTSRANAEFALVSSVPAIIPVLGGLAAGAADTLVLTKNQALLVYKMAGIFGRDVDDRLALALEIAPVVGGAFLWRSIARTLVGMLPGLVGGIPKVGIAYAGTYAVGQMARYYYATGRRPSPELVQRFQLEGARLARDVVTRLQDWRKGPTSRDQP
jgi:uncharacterized protein (DUF697 family)